MLSTLVYKLTGSCKSHMKNEKLGELQLLVCPPSRKQATPCRYEMHAVCDHTAPDVSQLSAQGITPLAQWCSG